MGNVAGRTRHKATEVLAAIGTAGADPGHFARIGVAELPRLVASELTTLSVCDLDSGHREVVGNGGVALSAQDIAAFDRHFFEHPLVRFHTKHRRGGTHRISDALPSREFKAGALYNEYYRRIGIDHAAAVPLFVDDETLVSFVFNRKGRDFSDAEVALFDELRGWLAAMYRNAVALKRAAEALAQMRQIAEADDWAVVRLDAKRRIRDLSAPAASMLAAACPGTSTRAGAALPEPIHAWLRTSARGTSRLALSPLVLKGEHGDVIVRAMPELAGEAAWILLVRGDAPAMHARAGLTSRELEILRWVSAGKSDRQIASILDVSHRTVQKHLEHTYTKLGVENRTAAAMRALRLVEKERQ
jgi:DNA-binding CsgD family transcriptional regulator